MKPNYFISTWSQALLRAVGAGILCVGLGLGNHALACDIAGNPCAETNSPTVQSASGPVGAAAGNPINVITGNKYQQETDLPALPGVLGLEIVRHYNSALSGKAALPGPLGRGWRLSYESELWIDGNDIHIRQADGSRVVFGRDLLNKSMARHIDPARGSITVIASARGDEFVWTWNDGRKLSFNHRGKLVQVHMLTGEILSMQHDVQGMLVRVTDPQGRSLRLTWLDKESGRHGDRFRGVQSIDSPVGRFGYEYGSDMPKGAEVDKVVLLANLAAVTYPASPGTASTGRRYHYEDGMHPTLLTGVSFEGKDNASKQTSVRYSTFGYRNDGKAVLSTHAGDVSKVTLDYDVPGQTTLTNSLGQTSVYRHDAISGDYRLLEVRGAGCALCGEMNVRYQYDKTGRLVETVQLDAEGMPVRGLRTDWDIHGRKTQVGEIGYIKGNAQPLKLKARYEYADDQKNEPAVIIRPSVVPGKEATIHATYNRVGQLLRLTESGWNPTPPGSNPPAQITRTISYTYRPINGRSVLVQVDGPQSNGTNEVPEDSDIVALDYDPQGNFVTKTTTPGNVVKKLLQQDSALRPTISSRNDGKRLVTTYAHYDYRGAISNLTQSAEFAHPTRATGILARHSSYTYDGQSRITSATGADRTTMRINYNDRENSISTIDAEGNRKDTRLDSEGRQFSTVISDSSGAAISGTLNLWDEKGNLTARITPEGKAEIFRDFEEKFFRRDGAYRESNRPVPQRQTTQQAGNTQQQHQIAKDDFGRISFEISPIEGITIFEYTGNWFRRHRIEQDGKMDVVESLEFSSNGNPNKRILAGCTETFRYEGELLATIDGCNSTHAFERNALGQITEHKQTLKNQTKKLKNSTFRSVYIYDSVTGQLVARRLLDGQRLNYQFDSISGKLRSISRDANWLVWIDMYSERIADILRENMPGSLTRKLIASNIVWQPFGGVSAITAANGITEKMRYDNRSRIVQVNVLKIEEGLIDSVNFRYGHSGNLTSALHNKTLHEFSYDRLRRLTAETVTASSSSGNASAPTVPYGEEKLALTSPALIASTSDAILMSLDNIRTFDSFGRTQTRGEQLLYYDAANRLVKVENRGITVATYRYDALGNRIAKTTLRGTVHFLYDTAHRLVAEADEHGNLTSQYLYAGFRPIAVMRPSGQRLLNLFSIHSDHRGSPLIVADMKGSIVWRKSFYAFGSAKHLHVSHQTEKEKRIRTALNPPQHQSATTFIMPLRMAGQYEDEETGFFYNIHRYYDPHIGRYLTPDPLGVAGGADVYSYASGDPLTQIDPLGLYPYRYTHLHS